MGSALWVLSCGGGARPAFVLTVGGCCLLSFRCRPVGGVLRVCSDIGGPVCCPVLCLSTYVNLSEYANSWALCAVLCCPCPLQKQQLAHEKKLVVIHRLHQILMPFMLRRQVRELV